MGSKGCSKGCCFEYFNLIEWELVAESVRPHQGLSDHLVMVEFKHLANIGLGHLVQGGLDGHIQPGQVGGIS